MKQTILLLLLLALFVPPKTVLASDEHRIGGGFTYWTAIDDIELDSGDVDDDGLSIFGSYQYWPSLIGFEVAVDFLPDRFGESAIAPQAYVLVGKSLYVAAGIGINYSDGEISDEPFFALRGGLNLEALPGIFVDVYGTYRFNERADIDNEDTDIDTDTVFFGAAVRLAY